VLCNTRLGFAFVKHLQDFDDLLVAEGLPFQLGHHRSYRLLRTPALSGPNSASVSLVGPIGLGVTAVPVWLPERITVRPVPGPPPRTLRATSFPSGTEIGVAVAYFSAAPFSFPLTPIAWLPTALPN
jgi:hypothetical protein